MLLIDSGRENPLFARNGAIFLKLVDFTTLLVNFDDITGQSRGAGRRGDVIAKKKTIYFTEFAKTSNSKDLKFK